MRPRIWLIKKFGRKNKNLKFRTKNAKFAYFAARIWKYYWHIWNRHPRICLIAKFCEIIKIPKFRTKNALFWYFWTRTLKNYCHIWNQHPRICLIANFSEKLKMSKFWPKMLYLGIFGVKFENYFVIFEISLHEFV